MRKPTLYLAKALLVAAALLFATAGPALAQHRGGGHGGGGFRGGAVHGGVVRGGVVHGGVVRGGFRGDGFRGGFRGGWGGGYGGWGGGWGWGYPWYGYGGWGGYYPYYDSNYYGSPYYGYSPYDSGYYSSDYYAAQPYQDPNVAPGTGSYSFYPPPVAAADNNTAKIEVRVAPDAELWFDGTKTTQRGPMRSFTTPPLTPGKTFNYEVKATWMVNGAPVTQTRQVTVEAGKRNTINFLEGGPQAKD
jgi:uncharacterized protein (TIGR03000 family)